MISVVMPVYNGEKYIKESIESVLKQTFQDFELIIVNDASTDRTREIIDEYAQKDARIKIINNETNQKLPHSLNIGFEACKGEYYTWTSDDNIYYEDAFKVMFNLLKTKPHIDFVFAREEYIDEYGKKIGLQIDPKDLDELYCKSVMSGCFMYKKIIHETLNGYDVTKFLIEDYDFFRRAYINYKFEYIPQTLYSYRRHSGSLSETRMVDVRKRKIDLLEESLKEELPENIRVKIYRELCDSYYEISDVYKNMLKNQRSKEYNELRRNKIRSFIKAMVQKMKCK